MSKQFVHIKMADKPMKITLHQNGSKRNIYRFQSSSFENLRDSIANILFEGETAQRSDFRIYWIDEDSDEIDIVNPTDYQIFLGQNKDRAHLHAIPIGDVKQKPNESANAPFDEKLFPTRSKHTFVECDACNAKPIIGFRYKCIECPNFDLCQRCEAMHYHPEHMMVRMPHDNCPNVIETWVTGCSKRSHKRASRGHCPFMPRQTDEMPGTAPGGGDTERHHGRRSHKRRDLNTGVFGHLYTMMQDLAEGGVKDDTENANNKSESPVNVASAAAAAAAAAASNVAAAAASDASKAVFEAFNVAKQAQTGAENPKASTNDASTPKTPPTTPAGAGGNDIPEPEPTPVLNTPSLENLSQFIDPQYMRAGIQILNNFSDMFAKMLDPNDGVGMSCPINPANTNAERKNSTTSTASGNDASSSKSASSKVENQTSEDQSKKPNGESPTSTTNTPPISIATTTETQTVDGNRSQSLEDSEWQMIDKQVASLISEHAATENDAQLDNTKSNTPKSMGKTFDYAQLSKDLKAHIEGEQLREIAAELAKANKKPPTVDVSTTIPSVSADVGVPTAPTAPIASAASTQTPSPQPHVPEEKRAVLFFHADPRINNAVHAMMAMGFSNEGAWLTQLLESVNGNIPEALDLMNAAQRNK